MRRRLSWIAAIILLSGAALIVAGAATLGHRGRAAPRAEGQIPVDYQSRRPTGKVYEGRIKDVRPAWGVLILTVGKGKAARDMQFDMGEARIVGPYGNEYKGGDLWIGDRVRVELTPDGSLVQQIDMLGD